MFYLQELKLKFLDFGLPIDIVIIEKPLNPDECGTLIVLAYGYFLFNKMTVRPIASYSPFNQSDLKLTHDY